MNTRIIAAIAAALLGVAGSGIARAQVIPYVDTACGVWNGDVWTPNGHCDASLHKHERIEGTITAVSGHLVTVARTGGNVTIDDTPALNNQLTGKVAVGRRIVAHGYWDAQTFYATVILTRDAATTG